MMMCIVLALIFENGSISTSYRHWLEMNAGVVFGEFQLIKPLLLWINDGLITIFFFSIGLQLKIEFVKGNLSNPRNIILPALAAMGGILFPTLVFTAFNYDNAYAMRGWAIPTSTDTAFSIAILLLLGSRVPASLKILLLSTSVFDDMGAMMILAVFYTSELSLSALVLASFAIFCLVLLNYFGVGRRVLYLCFGLLLWFSILKSGVHATLAGIITAFLIPMKSAEGELMVEPISDGLKVWVSLFVLPLFAIANAGIDLSMMDITAFFAPVSLGIFFALTIGKPLGVFLVIWTSIKVRLVKQPTDANMIQIYGMCILTGIGFSMAFFYDSLAYGGSSKFNYADALAILIGSCVSGIYGYLFLRFVACRIAAIEYRPWLPSPFGYKGTARTANLYTLDQSAQGPASVAPTAALVAEANARAAAAAAAAEAADKAAQAAKQAAEAAKAAVESEDEADEEALAKVQLAAAQAAQAAASAAVSTAKLDDSEEAETAEVAAAALEVATAATEVAKEVALEVTKEDSEDTGDKDEGDVQKDGEDKPSSKSASKASSQEDEEESELDEDKESSKKAKSKDDSEDEEGEDKKSGITLVATKAIAKVVSSIIPEKDEEDEDKSKDKSNDEQSKDDKETKSDKDAKSTKNNVSALRADGKEEVHDLDDDDGPKTVISVDSVGFAKVQPLVEEPKEEIEPLLAQSVAPDEVAEHERILKGEVLEPQGEQSKSQESVNDLSKPSPESSQESSDSTKSTKDLTLDTSHDAKAQEQADTKLESSVKPSSEQGDSQAQATEQAPSNEQGEDQALATDDAPDNEEAKDSQGDKESDPSEPSEDKVKVEKKAKAKSKPDFDSDIYLSEVVGSVAAQVEKIAEEKAKTKKTVNVAELIEKAKNIEEAIKREAEKSKSDKSKSDKQASEQAKSSEAEQAKIQSADQGNDQAPSQGSEQGSDQAQAQAGEQGNVSDQDASYGKSDAKSQGLDDAQGNGPKSEDKGLNADDYQDDSDQDVIQVAKPSQDKEQLEKVDPLLASEVAPSDDSLDKSKEEPQDEKLVEPKKQGKSQEVLPDAPQDGQSIAPSASQQDAMLESGNPQDSAPPENAPQATALQGSKPQEDTPQGSKIQSSAPQDSKLQDEDNAQAVGNTNPKSKERGLLGAMFGFGKDKANKEQEPSSLDDSSNPNQDQADSTKAQGYTPQGREPQVSDPQISMPQGSTPQASSPQGSALQDVEPQASMTQASGPQGSALQDAEPQASTTQASGPQGSALQKLKLPGSEIQDEAKSANEGPRHANQEQCLASSNSEELLVTKSNLLEQAKSDAHKEQELVSANQELAQSQDNSSLTKTKSIVDESGTYKDVVVSDSQELAKSKDESDLVAANFDSEIAQKEKHPSNVSSEVSPLTLEEVISTSQSKESAEHDDLAKQD